MHVDHSKYESSKYKIIAYGQQTVPERGVVTVT